MTRVTVPALEVGSSRGQCRVSGVGGTTGTDPIPVSALQPLLCSGLPFTNKF